MTATPSEATWLAVLRRLDDASRDAGRLARLASLAVQVEPRLLRRLRLRFVHCAHTSCEADLWFSALVAVRDTGAFSWAPGAAAALRVALTELENIDLVQVRAEIAAAHAGAPPLVQLEERVAWLALRQAPRADLERELGRALAALLEQPAHADDLAAWAVRALPDLPEPARATAAAWQLRLAAASRFGTAPAMGVPPPHDLLAHVVRGVLVDRGHERLRVVRDAQRLWLEVAPGASDADPEVMTVPSTRPLWVEISSVHGRASTVVAVEPGQRAALDAGSGDVLRNALGDAWVLESARVAQLGASPQPEADAGEVLFGWIIVRLPPEAPEGWDAVRDRVLADLARSAGRVGRVDLILLLATDVTQARRAAIDAIGDQLRAAVGPDCSADSLLVSPVPMPSLGSDVVGEPPGDAQAVELTPTERVRVVVRADDRPAAWPGFSERVRAAMQASDGSLPAADLVIAIGRAAARLTERRFPVTVPLLIVDDASPWTVPPPGVRLPTPPLLWTTANPQIVQRDGDRPTAVVERDSIAAQEPDAAYGLGCVRAAFPATEESAPAGFVAAIARSWRGGEWRERTMRSPAFDMHYPGDRDLGWNRNQIAVVVGDPERDGFVTALRAWWEAAGPPAADSFVVVATEGVVASRNTEIDLPLRDRTARVWLFLREGARRDHFEAVARRISMAELICFCDRRRQVLRKPETIRMPLWLAFVSDESREMGPPVTSAALEALLGAARHRDAIRLRDIQRHLTARLVSGAEIVDLRSDPDADDTVAPAPKHVRIDTSSMHQVIGGAMRQVIGGDAPEQLPVGAGARIVFVARRNAATRSAWIDRWLQILSTSTDEPRPIFGWTPWLAQPEPLVAHIRTVLLDWTAPAAPLDDARELAWRIEGSNAIFILDGLGVEATGFERRLIEACSLLDAGTLVVSSPQLGGWMEQVPHATWVDLDELVVAHDLIRQTEIRLEDAWPDALASIGHDLPVLVAIDLARAAAQTARPGEPSRALRDLDAWLVDGNPFWLGPPESALPGGVAADRIAHLAIEAARALSGGDTERMLVRARDAGELALSVLGPDGCRRVLRANAGDPAQVDREAPPPDASFARRELWPDPLLDRVERSPVPPVGRGTPSPDASFARRASSSSTSFDEGTPSFERSAPPTIALPVVAATHRLRILHLSDLHIRGARESANDRGRRDRMLGASWFANLAELRRDGDFDLVVITGDVAFTGALDEYLEVMTAPRAYRTAGTWLDETLAAVGCTRAQLYVVPGNHDIDRRRHYEAWRMVRGAWSGADPENEPALTRWIVFRDRPAPRGLAGELRGQLLEREAAYHAWIAHGLGRPDLLPDPRRSELGYRARLAPTRLPFPVHIIGLDSAWLAGDDSDVRKVRLTDDQVLQLCTDDDGASLTGLRIALVHHPLADLADGARARRLLWQHGVELVLCGHMHDADTGNLVTSDGQLHDLGTGCLYPHDRYHCGVTALTLTLEDSGRIRGLELRVRGWMGGAAQWLDDDSFYRGTHGGRLTWSRRPEAEAASAAPASEPGVRSSMPADAKLRDVATPAEVPYFFLSYARADVDEFFERFYSDFRSELRGKLGLTTVDGLAFRDTEVVSLGALWKPRIERSLLDCRTFLAMLSPTYLTRPECAREWAGFEWRRTSYGQPPELLLPVIWIPIPDRKLPPAIQQRQYKHQALGRDYATHGLRYLVKRRGTQYRNFLEALAANVYAVVSQPASPSASLPVPGQLEDPFR